MYTVAVMVGSLREGSINRKLFRALQKLNTNNLTFVEVSLDLPLYNQDLEADLPYSVRVAKKVVADADAALFITPEYNRSIPAALKNGIDWCSRPYGKNLWQGMPAAATGSSGGRVGTAVAQNHLRSVMVMLGMVVLGQPAVYFLDPPGLVADAGSITDESTRQFLSGFLDAFAAWIDKHKK
jgi:chromate reductase